MSQPAVKLPSSGTAGFFQKAPQVPNAIEDDRVLNRVAKFYLPASLQSTLIPALSDFSDRATTPQIFNWAADAERNVPHLRSWDSWGRRIDDLVTSPGWQSLQAFGIAEGMVALGHEREHQQYNRVYQFLKYHIWTPMSCCVTCPSAMTDGAARLIFLYLQRNDIEPSQRPMLEKAHAHLTSRDPSFAWTSGQWMTERIGGSDVRETETQASLTPFTPSTTSTTTTDVDGNPLGPYSINGFKWFSSATDANMTILLAQEPPHGLSAFYAPMHRLTTTPTSPTPTRTLNGITIQRLKPKLGTRALPTAELILSDLRAHRLGAPGSGVREISTVLNITRVHNAVTAVGLWGRGIAVAKAFARVRKVRGGRTLAELAAHVESLAAATVEYAAMMHLAFFAVAGLGVVEAGGKGGAGLMAGVEDVGKVIKGLSGEEVGLVLRLVTPLAKALTARAAIAGLAECMEALGGVGYCENEDLRVNVARWFRDANVLSIWEGTTNIMADDVVRIVKGRAGPAVMAALGKIVDAAIAKFRQARIGKWIEHISKRWQSIRTKIAQTDAEELLLNGRSLSIDLAYVICSLLLGLDALSDGSPIAAEIASRWILGTVTDGTKEARKWTERAEWNSRIVFGDSKGQIVDAKL